MEKRLKTRLKFLTKKLKAITAKDIMTKNVITTTENTKLSDLAELMVKLRISGLPVVRGKGKTVGIITATDLFLVMDMIKSGDVLEHDLKIVFNPTVKYAMSTDFTKIDQDTTLEEIIVLMKYKNIHTFPVFARSKMVGIIGRHDVFKTFYEAVKGGNHK